MSATDDPVWDEWAGIRAALDDITAELNDLDDPPSQNHRAYLAAHRAVLKARHDTVNASLTLRRRTEFVRAFHGFTP